jgi:hypothetical protein
MFTRCRKRKALRLRTRRYHDAWTTDSKSALMGLPELFIPAALVGRDKGQSYAVGRKPAVDQAKQSQAFDALTICSTASLCLRLPGPPRTVGIVYQTT